MQLEKFSGCLTNLGISVSPKLQRALAPSTITATLLRVRQLSNEHRLVPCKSILSSLAVPHSFLYSIIFQCVLPHRSLRDVTLYTLDIMHDHAYIFSSFVSHLGSHGRFEELARAIQRLSSSGDKLSSECGNTLLRFCCQGDNSEVGLQILLHMEMNGVDVEKGKYRDLYFCCCRNGNINGADMMLRRIADLEGLRLDFRTCESFLQALCVSGKLREAKKLFDKMRRWTGTFSRKSEGTLCPGKRVIFQMGPLLGVKEGTVVLDVFFWLLCKAGCVDEAERLWKDSGRGSLTMGRSFVSFVEALFSAGRVDEAMRLFEAEKRRGNEWIGKIAGSLVDGLCGAGRVDNAMEVMRQTAWSNDVTNLRVWNRILECLWDHGRDEEAKDMFRSRESHNASTHEIMAHGLLLNDEFQSAMSFLGKLIVNGSMGGISLYCAVATWLYRNGKEEEAFRCVDFMLLNGMVASYSAWETFIDLMMSKVKDSGLVKHNCRH